MSANSRHNPNEEGDMYTNNTPMECSTRKGPLAPVLAAAPDLASESPHSPSICNEDKHFTLSLDERQMIALIMAGYTKTEMARHFTRSESTIDRRTVRILDKLGVSNKFELVLFAISHQIAGATPPEPPD
jgi:DNA-binding NarL/FixJ family response regulator